MAKQCIVNRDDNGEASTLMVPNPNLKTNEQNRNDTRILSTVAGKRQAGEILEGASNIIGTEANRTQKKIWEKEIESWARENNHWLEIDSLGEYITQGAENLVFDYSESSVVKVNFDLEQDFEDFTTKITTFNALFPHTGYEVIGFTRLDRDYTSSVGSAFGKGVKGDFAVVMKQNYVPSKVEITASEITEYMTSLGFEATQDPTVFTKGKITVSDLHLDNVLKTEDGTYHVIDGDVEVEDNYQFEIQEEEIQEEAVPQTRQADLMPMTLSIFQRPEFVKLQGKMVNPITILNSLNQQGVKQIEKDLVKAVIEKNYQGQKKVNYDELETAIRANIMPLDRVKTKSYSNYGMDNLGQNDYGQSHTIILNSPIEHGYVGNHFGSDFKKGNTKKIKYVSKQLDANTWVAVEENYEQNANENNIYEYVGTAGSEVEVKEWIDSKNKFTLDISKNNTKVVKDGTLYSLINTLTDFQYGGYYTKDTLDLEGDIHQQMLDATIKSLDVMTATFDAEINKGMFGHFRVWNDGSAYTVAEAQSDYFQNNNARKQILENKIQYKDALTAFGNAEYSLKESKRAPVTRELYQGGYMSKTPDKGPTTIHRIVNNFGQELGKNEGIKIDTSERGKYIITREDGRSVSGMQYLTEEKAIEELERMTSTVDYSKSGNTDSLTREELPENLRANYDYLTVEYPAEIKKLEKERDRKIEDVFKNLTIEEKQFIAAQKEWEKRLLREALKDASKTSAKVFRLPTPHTLSTIEGYIQGEESEYSMPYEYVGDDTDIEDREDGDYIEHAGQEYIVTNSQPGGFDAVPTNPFQILDVDDYLQDLADKEIVLIEEQVLNSVNASDSITQDEVDKYNGDYKQIVQAVLTTAIRKKIENGEEAKIELFEHLDEIETVFKRTERKKIEEDAEEYFVGNDEYRKIIMLEEGRYFVTKDRVDSTHFGQPSDYQSDEEMPSKEDFNIDDLNSTQKTVAYKYLELARLLEEEVGEENVNIITDANGYDWYETDVNSAIGSSPIIAFSIEEEKTQNIYPMQLTAHVMDMLMEKNLVSDVVVISNDEVNEMTENIDLKKIIGGFFDSKSKAIFINEDSSDLLKTTMHEFAHPTLQWLRENKNEHYLEGIKLLKKYSEQVKPYSDTVIRLYPSLKEGSDAFYEEVLARMVADNGMKLINSVKNSDISDWIRNLWDIFSSMMGITSYTPSEVSRLTLSEFTDAVVAEMMNEEEVKSYSLAALESAELSANRGKMVNPITIQNALKKQTIKQVERGLMESVLELEQFQNQKRINYDEFEYAVKAQIMPLVALSTDEYAQYGMQNVDFDYDVATTLVYNSPITHGIKGHFDDIYEKLETQEPYTMSDLYGVDEDTGERYFSSPSERAILYSETTAEYRESELKKANERLAQNNLKIIKQNKNKNKGLFGHTRVWIKDEVYTVSEVQSDVYQKKDFEEKIKPKDQVQSIEEELQPKYIAKLAEIMSPYPINLSAPIPNYIGDNDGSKTLLEIAYAYERENANEINKLKELQYSVRNNRDFEEIEKQLNDLSASGFYRDRVLEMGKLMVEYRREFENNLEDTAKYLGAEEKQFKDSKKYFELRLIRESIQDAARRGSEKIRLPLPYTLAKIENHFKEDTNAPSITFPDGVTPTIGVEVEHRGEKWIVSEVNDGAKAARIQKNLKTVNVVEATEKYLSDFSKKIREKNPGSTKLSDLKGFTISEEINFIKMVREIIKNQTEQNSEIVIKVEDYAKRFIESTRREIKLDFENHMSRKPEIYGEVFSSFESEGVIYYGDFNTPSLFLSWRNESDKVVNKENFTFDDIVPKYQGIGKRYIEMGKMLEKERGKENFRIVTDANGYDWYEADIDKIDRTTPIIAFNIEEGPTKEEFIPSQLFDELSAQPFVTKEQALEMYKSIYSEELNYWKNAEMNCK